jgi:hypothetical protein
LNTLKNLNIFKSPKISKVESFLLQSDKKFSSNYLPFISPPATATATAAATAAATFEKDLMIKSQEISNTSNINNIININFNNFDEIQNSTTNNHFDTEEEKKIFFEILYESLKLNKKFKTLVEEVSKEDIFNNIINKNIPVYKYFTYITNYLRKSKPNILHNVRIEFILN